MTIVDTIALHEELALRTPPTDGDSVGPITHADRHVDVLGARKLSRLYADVVNLEHVDHLINELLRSVVIGEPGLVHEVGHSPETHDDHTDDDKRPARPERS